MDTAMGHGLGTARPQLRGHFSAWTFLFAQAAATLRIASVRERCAFNARQHFMGIEVGTKCTSSEGNAMNCEPHVRFPQRNTMVSVPKICFPTQKYIDVDA